MPAHIPSRFLVPCLLAAVAAWPRPSHAAGRQLQPHFEAGERTGVQVALEVGGELKTVEQGKVTSLKMSVAARLQYDEKLLVSGEQGKQPLRSFRYYSKAEAVIKIEKDGFSPTLRDERRLVVADAGKTPCLLFSPLGPLSREELDLVDVPGNSLLVDRLLPNGSVAVGDRWQHADDLLAALLGLDAVSDSDVTSELKESGDTTARIELSGKVQGAIGGVATEIELKGKYTFDFQRRRVTWLGLLIREKRSIGLVGPGLDVVAKLQLSVGPASSVEQLADDVIEGLELQPQEHNTLLEYASQTGNFRLACDRRWQIMNEAPRLVALRLVDRGELIVQCNVAALPKVDPGRHVTLDEFQQDIRRSLDKSFKQFLAASQSAEPEGRLTYRVQVAGEAADLPMQWNYYLVANPDGQQVVFAFTVEPELAERLQGADEQLVGSLEIMPGGQTAAKPATPGRTR